MKALVWHGGQELSWDDAPDPEPREGEVVLGVEPAGICGSDLHGHRGHPGPRVAPLVLGQAFADLVERPAEYAKVLPAP